jgi:hypothetical protein
VNAGTHNLTGEVWWVLDGDQGITITNNAASLAFELAAQGNDWGNQLLPRNPGDQFPQLQLSHK